MLHEILNSPGFRGCMFVNAALEFPRSCDPAHQAATRAKDATHKILLDLASAASACDAAALAEELMILMVGAAVMLASDRVDMALVAKRPAQLVLQRYLPAN